MGGTISKPQMKNVSTDFKEADLLDMIAAKYILTQNFQDMKKLSQKPYCDKLVILTSDIMKKFMKEKTVDYLGIKHGIDGIPQNYMTKEKIMYLDTGDIENKYQSGGSDWLGSLNYSKLMGYQDYQDNVYDNKKKDKKVVNKKPVLSRLDVKNSAKKYRMCKGIAQFYISIAHLFAAIVRTVNPIYVYTGSDGKPKEASIMRKDTIPTGAKPVLKINNLCSKRINRISPKMNDGNVKINLKKVCSMNLESKTVTRDTDPNRPMLWGQTIERTRTLKDEPGIPQLRELYNDYYDFDRGEFTKMIPEGRGDKQFKKDLQEFYNVFTGKTAEPYEEWNAGGDKDFSDIDLQNFNKMEVCAATIPNFKQTYIGENKGLFSIYAEHVSKMMKNAETNRADILSILDELFKLQTIQTDKGDQEVVTINPVLNNKSLADITAKTRTAIVKLYIRCESDFKVALDIFNKIALQRAADNTVNREINISDQIGLKLTEPVANAELLNDITTTLKDIGKDRTDKEINPPYSI